MDQELMPDSAEDRYFSGKDNAENQEKVSSPSNGSSQLESQVKQFYFPVRGNNINTMVEASDNLFSFIIRINSLNEFADIERLYQQVNDEILALDTELRECEDESGSMKYDQAMILTARYCLCTVIDEAVLRTEWGRESHWSNQSLLSKHHGETWGGEKFYKILSRLMMNPEKYRDILEFMYFCLSLGYEGQYGLDRQGESKRKVVIEDLREVLLGYWEKPSHFLTNANKHTVAKNYLRQINIPSWLIYVLALIFLIVVYQTFDFLLDEEIKPILEQLK